MERYESRREKLRRRLKKLRLDSLLVTNFKNVTYLTGFTGDDSFLLVTPDHEIMISDFRYVTQLAEECPGLETHIRRTGSGKSIIESTAGVIRSAKLPRVGVESGTLSLAQFDDLSPRLKGELVRTSHLIESLREIKDKSEIEQIRLAVRCAERAFGVLKASLRGDQTEKQICDELEHNLRRFGASGSSFPPIVAVGPRAALPHASVGHSRVDESELLLVDWGAQFGLYKSDLTRVLVTAKISPKLERIYGVVLNAQQQATAAIRPGVAASEIDAIARGVISDAGFGRHFGHGLGHGIGLDIHEGPRLSSASDEPLKAGMVITVEPGIYLPGWGGVRIEDDVLVTRSGHEVLSSVSRELDDAVVGLD